jgi:acetyltransferase-like isoleucine patch superfamily enzyme
MVDGFRHLWEKAFNWIARKPSKAQPPGGWFFTRENPAYSGHEIGEWTYGTPLVLSWGEGARLKIGKYCSIADGVTILLGGEHRTDWVTTYPFSTVFTEASQIPGHPKTRGDVVIENDVWIGRDVFILSGVHIGNGAVIGAKSVVTKNVAPYSIVAGNPARAIRDRFTREQQEALLKIGWWNWDEAKVREAVPMLLCNKIDDFVGKHLKNAC